MLEGAYALAMMGPRAVAKRGLASSLRHAAAEDPASTGEPTSNQSQASHMSSPPQEGVPVGRKGAESEWFQYTGEEEAGPTTTTLTCGSVGACSQQWRTQTIPTEVGQQLISLTIL